MAGEHYTVQEVQSLTGVQARTIRHWIRKRLIPRPIGRGRAARYSASQVLSIRVIHHLRMSRMSLNAIRTRIATLSDEQLRALLPPPASARSTDAVPEPPPAPSYPAVIWETVTLIDGLILLVRADTPSLRRLANEIYRYYGRAPAQG